jgi:hypothetical protein
LKRNKKVKIKNIRSKKMKKLVSIIAAFLMMAGMSFAQYNHSMAIDVAGEVNVPMSSLYHGATTGWATTARYEFNMGAGFTGMITSGYGSFGEDNNLTYHYVPVLVGAKLYFIGGWYGMLETGYHFFTIDNSNPAIGSTTKSEWGASVGTGVEIPLSESVGLDVSTKWQYNVDDLSYWNTRVGVMFYL